MKQVHLSAIRHRPAKVFKFGIKIPCDFEDAERPDREYGNSLWRDAHAFEMKQLLEYKTFDSLGIGALILDDYEKIKMKIVNDCKPGYRRRARCVACGDSTKNADPESTYSSVVSLKSLRTVMFIGELNGFSMYAGDIGSSCLLTKTYEKIAFVAGPNFGEYAGSTLAIIKALYELKTSGGCYHDYWADERWMSKNGFHQKPTVIFGCVTKVITMIIWLRGLMICFMLVKTLMDSLDC